MRWIIGIFFLWAQVGFAQDMVGRAKLVLPEGTWITVSAKDIDAVKYTGGVDGVIKGGMTVRALIDADKNLYALLFVRSGEHGINAMMSYSDGCKRINTEYIDDATRGSYTKLDCLRVWRSMSPTAWLKQSANKEVYDELEKLGIKPSVLGYFFSHSVGSDNGTTIRSHGILAHSVLAQIPEAAKDAKYAGMPGVAWAQQMADADRASVFSLSGELKVPQIIYR